MGIPLETTDITQALSNPLGTNGLAFVEFSAKDILPVENLFERLGFERIAIHRQNKADIWGQGGVRFILNRDPDSHGAHFASLHGPCISALGFRVADADAATSRAVQYGADLYSGNPVKLLDAPALEGIGGSLLYMIDHKEETRYGEIDFPGLNAAKLNAGVGVTDVDHLTHNVTIGNVDRWANFYREVFGFREVFYFHGTGAATGFRTKAMKSPCDKICIPVNEPTEAQSQIQEWIDEYRGEGVQHIALLSDSLNSTIEQIADREIPFMSIPDSYYTQVDTRLPGHGEDLARLRRNGILLDGRRSATGSWELLLQIFSKNLIGPIFFECIQRKGNDGFGEGNAKALFEAIERDQIDRGTLKP